MKRIAHVQHSRLPESNPATQSKRTRGGWSLIQLLVIMTFVTIITAIAARLISSLLRVERHSLAHLNQLSHLSRLSRQFRSDVHAGRESRVIDPPEPDRVRITLENGNLVSYGMQNSDLIRIEKAGEKVVRRERYRLPNTQVVCETSTVVVSKTMLPIVTLIVRPDNREISSSPNSSEPIATAPRAASSERQPKELRIEARLGRDHSDHSVNKVSE